LNIARSTIQLGGEIGSCLMQNPLPFNDAIETIVKDLDLDNYQHLLQELKDVGREYADYGIEDLQELAERLDT
jgi:spore germination protein YaaH